MPSTSITMSILALLALTTPLCSGLRCFSGIGNSLDSLSIVECRPAQTTDQSSYMYDERACMVSQNQGTVIRSCTSRQCSDVQDCSAMTTDGYCCCPNDLCNSTNDANMLMAGTLMMATALCMSLQVFVTTF